MKTSVVYAVDYREGYDWWAGRLKDPPLPTIIDPFRPFVCYIHNVHRQSLMGCLYVIGLMVQSPNCKALIWRSTCDIVLQWSRVESEAMSIYQDEAGLRWMGIPNSQSRFTRVAKRVALRRNYAFA